MKDSEILERLIYRAYVAPATRTLEDAAFVPLAAALRLYARTYAMEAAIITDQPEPACADACPVEYTAPTVLTPDTPPEPDTHTAGTSDGDVRTPADIAGYGAGEKRMIYAELMAFIATHGLGARRKIAECSNGVLTVEDLLNMQNCRRVTLSKWRVARAAMEQIEQEEKEQGG